MKKKLLYSILLIFITTMAYTQSEGNKQIKPVVGQTEVTHQIPVLGPLADQVNTSHEAYVQTSVSSRSEYAKARSTYESALDSYLSELEHQLATADTKWSEQLRSEITLVKELRNDLNSANTKR